MWGYLANEVDMPGINKLSESNKKKHSKWSDIVTNQFLLYSDIYAIKKQLLKLNPRLPPLQRQTREI